MHEKSGRERLSELTSSLGAGILGLGLGAFFSAHLGRIALALAGLGACMHAFGMWDMRRMEKAGRFDRPIWSTALYWACWIALLALAARLILQ